MFARLASTKRVGNVTSRLLLPYRQERSIANRELSSVSLQSTAKSILDLPAAYLRAADPSNYDSATLQRNDVPVDYHSGKPMPKRPGPRVKIEHHSLERNNHRIKWNDGSESEYPADWVDHQIASWNRRKELRTVDRKLWTNMTEEKFRDSAELCLGFDHCVSDQGMPVALKTLFEYGILLVTETPVHDDGVGVAALASALGGGTVKNSTTLLHNYRNALAKDRVIMLPRGTDGPLRTLYGTVWSTTSAGQPKGTSVADSAYGQDGLPLHTDMTYHRDPPGLQIFTMIQPAQKGGESVFGDGFAAAERLRQLSPRAFEILSTTIRRYRSVDRETGWHLEASGPVIQTHEGAVVAIRHNDLDRLPDLPPPGLPSPEVDNFYQQLDEAHFEWDQILGSDEMRLVVRLEPGDTVVVANQVSLVILTVAIRSRERRKS